MARSTPPPHDDFPINAFALLPPLACDDPHDSRDTAAQIAASVGVEQAQEDGATEVVSFGDAARFQVAKHGIRVAIEALYTSSDGLYERNAVLVRENAQLVEFQSSAKARADRVEGKLRQQVEAQNHEVVRLQQKIHEVERAKDRLAAENSELIAQVEEQDATIAALQDALEALKQHQHQEMLHASTASFELSALKEARATDGNLGSEQATQVRQAMVTVQQLGERLHEQLQRVHEELQATEKEYQVYRRFLANDKCQARDQSELPSARERDAVASEFAMLQTKLQTLEEQNLELSTHNKVLLTKCSEYEKTVRMLNHRLDEVSSKYAKDTSLLTKYEESATDGTQTIAEMQESLMKLCDQLAKERQDHGNRLQQLLSSASETEFGLQGQISTLKRSLQELQEQLEDAKRFAGTNGDGVCKSCQNAPSSGDHPTPSISTPEPHYYEIPVAQLDQSDDDDIEVDAAPPINLLPPQNQRESRRKEGKSKRRVELLAATTCGICNEDPFGFMVRCQKCKDPFHAGCVKNTVPGAKKRLGHIFKCINCAPQRPSKVVRVATVNSVASLSSPARSFVTQPPESDPTSGQVSSVIVRPTLATAD